MSFNSFLLARSVRRIHRGQSVALPFFQTSTHNNPSPTPERNWNKWQSSRSQTGHATQHVRPLDIKTISFQASDILEEVSTSFLKEGNCSPASRKISPYTSGLSDEMDISSSFSAVNPLACNSYTSSLFPASPPNPRKLFGNRTTPNNGYNNSFHPNPSATASHSFTSGVRATISNTRINTVTSEFSPGPPSIFQKPSALPSLLYHLPPPSSEIDDIQERDWNQEFNDVLESPLLERADRLHKLEKEFVEVASKIGKVIIAEKNVHPSQKTVKTMAVDSGYAGGEKFQSKGIFFKFAVDGHNLYGSDEYAMKVACHELKGHTALVSCGMMHGLKLGLMTIIDYQGSRLTAVSVLPISGETLVYGSSDAGNVVCTSLDAMNEVMKQCGKVLNLKGHLAGIGDDKKFIYGPCDLEGHLGHDGRLYAIDLARLFPPETPEKSLPGGFLYRLLRPELVRQFDKPLSSDAFTMFGLDNSEVHDAEVRQASDFLHSQIIPAFANSLSQEAAQSIDEILVKLHRAGINIRYLGEVRSFVTDSSLRKVLLTEIYTRVFKNEIRSKLRDSTSKEQLIVGFFNTIFGDTPVASLFWRAMKKSVNRRFAKTLHATEMQADCDLRDYVDLDALFKRLQQGLGVTLRASRADLPLSLIHFGTFEVKAKQMYTIPRIEADTAAELARSTNDVEEAQRLLSLARKNYYSVLQLKPDDHVVLSNLGMVLAETAMLTSPQEREPLFKEANEKFETSIQLNGDDPHTLVMWSDALINQVILQPHTAKTNAMLKFALEMSLKAESFQSGIGSVLIARASALQGHEKAAKKWLSHAGGMGKLPSKDELLHDPAFSSLQHTEWFECLVC